MWFNAGRKGDRMNTRMTLAVSLILAVVLLTACEPAEPAPTPTLPPEPSVPALATEPPAPVATEPPQVALTETPTFIPRGPNLEASDPTTVDLASGTPVLVEFFAFW